jgi:hypothetical protein
MATRKVGVESAHTRIFESDVVDPLQESEEEFEGGIFILEHQKKILGRIDVNFSNIEKTIYSTNLDLEIKNVKCHKNHA